MKKKGPKEGDVRISKDWPLLAGKLAGVLSEMTEDQFLIIQVKNSSRFVQFAAQGSHGMRAEISSNAYLSVSDRLTDRQVAGLVKTGWEAPTGSPSESTPENDPDGSPNFFIDFPAPLKPSRIARQAVQALSEILRIPHPGFLEYEAFESNGKVLHFPSLGVKRIVKEEKANLKKTETNLLYIVREITGIGDLEYDKDGDIALRYGSITMYVSIIGNPPLIRFYSPLVKDVRGTQRLHARLNELNSGVGFMHFFIRDKVIFAISEISAASLQYGTVAESMGRFSAIADGVDEMLEFEFGGKTLRLANAESAMVH
ncbi:MAG: YbjN domain-containing protein [Acidobacteria bacterium]|nr:YbjN domain-containing protein [Acidobacteriota bacterium]